MKIFLEILTILYGGVGLVSVIAYWPTIKDLWHKKPSANSTSFEIWTLTSGITFLYSHYIVNNLLFSIVSGINFGLTAVVLVLRLRIRRK